MKAKNKKNKDMKDINIHIDSNIITSNLLSKITDEKSFFKALRDKEISLIKSKKVYVNYDRSRTVFTYINGVDFLNGFKLWFKSIDCYEGSIAQKDLFYYLQVDLNNGFSITKESKEIYSELSTN